MSGENSRDVEAELRAFGKAKVVSPEPVAALRERARHRQRRRRRQGTVISFACVLLIAGGLVLTSEREDSEPEVVVTGAPRLDADEAKWIDLPTSPLGARTDFFVASDSSQLYVVGGRDPQTGRPLRDGATIDLDTGEWRTLPAVPFDAPVVGMAADAGHVLAVGQREGTPSRVDVASYDSAENAWQPLTAPDTEVPYVLETTITDHQAVIATASTGGGDGNQVVVIDLSEDAALVSEPAPIDVNEGAFLWTGEAALLIGSMSTATFRGEVTTATFLPGSNHWETAEAPRVGRGTIDAVADGDWMYAWSAEVLAYAEVGSSGWSEPMEIPWGPQDCLQRGAPVGEDLLLWRCDQLGLLFDASHRQWFHLPAPPTELLETILVTEDGVVFWSVAGQGTLQPWLLEL